MEALAKPTTAKAADGDPMLVGSSNSATSLTYLSGNGFAVDTGSAATAVTGQSDTVVGVAALVNYATAITASSYMGDGLSSTAEHAGTGVIGLSNSGIGVSGANGSGDGVYGRGGLGVPMPGGTGVVQAPRLMGAAPLLRPPARRCSTRRSARLAQGSSASRIRASPRRWRSRRPHHVQPRLRHLAKWDLRHRRHECGMRAMTRARIEAMASYAAL